MACAKGCAELETTDNDTLMTDNDTLMTINSVLNLKQRIILIMIKNNDTCTIMNKY